MGLIKDTLARFFYKISKYLEHKFKERVLNKEIQLNQGRLGNMWFTFGDSHITQALNQVFKKLKFLTIKYL
jgi:hypothetical protein